MRALQRWSRSCHVSCCTGVASGVHACCSQPGGVVRCLQGELVQLEAQVAAKRAELQGMKQERDGLRAASQRVRDSTSTVSSPALLEDMKRQGEIKLELRYQVRG